MKAQIKKINENLVSLSYDRDGKRIERIFTCPLEGGYVREYENGEWEQVCSRLSFSGSTLISKNLIDVIRKEYRAMVRNEKKYF